jgi:hypothetical protein
MFTAFLLYQSICGTTEDFHACHPTDPPQFTREPVWRLRKLKLKRWTSPGLLQGR